MTTKIEWATETWNPITGCTPISEGCAHCYAKRMATRLKGRYGYPEDDPFQVTFHPDRLAQPLKWKKSKRIFVCSMGDLFHEDVKDTQINAVFEIMADNPSVLHKAPQHTYLILTKRPERILKGRIENFKKWPNVWLGVTCENQRTADKRIPILLQIPAAVKFVSIEPMLERINLEYFKCPSCGFIYSWNQSTKATRLQCPNDCSKVIPCDKTDEHIIMPDWVICGAETGPGARYMDPNWVRDIRDQCKQANVPFFIKKMSNKKPIPDDLMIREYPK